MFKKKKQVRRCKVRVLRIDESKIVPVTFCFLISRCCQDSLLLSKTDSINSSLRPRDLKYSDVLNVD